MELKVNDEFAKMMANNAASLSISHRHLGIYNHVFALLDDRDTMLAEIKRLTEDNARLRAEVEKRNDAMQEFIDRVDRGEVRSKYTYAEFKGILVPVEDKP